MPELIEVEAYRREAERTRGRRIAAVTRLDPLGVRGEVAEVAAVLPGCTVVGARRHGKLLLLDTDGPTVGLRFGMTGRLLVDGTSSIERLEWGGRRDDPAWDRDVLTFEGGGDLRRRDPRRLGGLELDPDTSRLGPDAAAIGVAALAGALSGSAAPVKARLLDQSRVAGLGNLLVDEILWRSGIDPGHPAGDLARTRVRALAATIRSTVDDLSERGGSHTGDLQVERRRGGVCPRDGTPLLRRRIGGRTTYSCPTHQR